MLKKISILFTLLIVLGAGCKLPNDAVVEPTTPPEITRISLYPSKIEVDKISIAFNPETIVDTTITVAVQVNDINNDIGTTYFNVISPNGTKLASNIQLNDKGSNSDSVAHDGIYFGTASISFKKKEIGSYAIQVVVGDAKELTVNVLSVLSITNSFNNAPQLTSLVVADTSVIQTGKDTAIVKISVRAQDQQGLNDIKNVNANILSLDGRYSVSVQLHDDGGTTNVSPYLLTSGDLTAGDGIYTIQVPFLKKHVSTYLLQVTARDSASALSNTLSKQFSIKNQINNKPVLSNVVMPDTAKVPPGNDTTFVKVSIAVNDVEGLDDIYSVYFTSLRPDNTPAGTFIMYDDGSIAPQPQFNLRSGDDTARDGFYTLTIPLTRGTVVPTYRDFVFQAKDRAGEVSSTITKRIYLR